MNKGDKIYVAGHRGLVGSAILRLLTKNGFKNIIYRTHDELELADQAGMTEFFKLERPDYVFLAAAKVGGIHANNTYPAEFIRSNIVIQANVIHAAWQYGVKKLLFLGSSCIYPRLAPQPMKEEYLLTGPLEPTNEWYAIAKIAGIKMCQAYRRQYGFNAISIMPTNLYGPGDNFDLENSHVLPALIRKFHEAKEVGKPEVVVWGSGKPRREFLHVDDLAEAALFLMEAYDDVTDWDNMFMAYTEHSTFVNHGQLEGQMAWTMRQYVDLRSGGVSFSRGEVTFTGTIDGKSGTLDIYKISKGIGSMWRGQGTNISIFFGGTGELATLQGISYIDWSYTAADQRRFPPMSKTTGTMSNTLWYVE